MEKYKFCPICSEGLSKGFIEERDREYCKKCGWIRYLNPIPVVACIVEKRGELLLIKRGIEPKKGSWALPGGFVEFDETPYVAAERELKEETGLKSIAEKIVGVELQKSSMYGYVLVIGVSLKTKEGTLIAGDDAMDVKFFKKNDLPFIPFLSHKKLIENYN